MVNGIATMNLKHVTFLVHITTGEYVMCIIAIILLFQKVILLYNAYIAWY